MTLLGLRLLLGRLLLGLSCWLCLYRGLGLLGPMAMRTGGLVAEVSLATLGTNNDTPCYFNAAGGAHGCFITYWVSALRTFDDCHNLSIYYYFMIYLLLFYRLYNLKMVSSLYL